MMLGYFPQVGDAKRCTEASLMLMEKHGVYVQDINFPTVPMGQEKLRIAPTPFHTAEMQSHFVNSLVDVWHELDLPFTKMENKCSYYEDYESLNQKELDFNLPLALLF